jgi:hypothetical protein
MAFDAKEFTKEVKARQTAETNAMAKAPTDSVYVCLDSEKKKYSFVKMKDIKLKLFEKYDTLENHLVDLINEVSLLKRKYIEQDALIEALLIRITSTQNAYLQLKEQIENEGNLGI